MQDRTQQMPNPGAVSGATQQMPPMAPGVDPMKTAMGARIVRPAPHPRSEHQGLARRAHRGRRPSVQALR